MASITTPIFKPLAMADISCLLSHPSIFTTKTPYSILSIPTKPIKLQQLSCSHSTTLFSPSFSLQRKNPSSAIVTFVAQNPESQLLVEEEDEVVWENQEFDDSGAPLFESEGEDAEIVATGEGAADGFVEEGEEVGGVYLEPSKDAKIFVGNLSYDIDSQGLRELFEQAGTVENADVIFNRDTNQSRGFGFVTMSTVEEAEKAVEKFNGHAMNGRSLTVNKAAPKGSRAERPPRVSEPAIRIYVGNLPWEVDNGRLEQIFSEHGKVVEARVVSDRETGQSRGFGFVTMSSETEMNDAIEALDGKTLNGRPIRVNVAEERPRRSFF